jgi:hypothetical protein
MKKLVFLVILLSVFQANAQKSNDNLLIYYPLDGNSLDSGDNKFHGLTNGQWVEDRNGNIGKALHFNGFDQYLDFPANRSQLKPSLPISMSFWVRFETYEQSKSVVVNTDFAQNNHSGVWVHITSWGVLAVNFGDAMGNTSPDNRHGVITMTPLELNTWYFVVCVVRGLYNIDVWVDCKYDVDYYQGYGQWLGYTDCQGGFGRKDADMYLPPYYFLGAIDDFRYWGRALSDDDIKFLCEEILARNGENIIKDFRVIPNPATETISLETSLDGIANITIIDMHGRTVMEILPKPVIYVGNLQAGKYIVVLKDRTGKLVEKSELIRL